MEQLSKLMQAQFDKMCATGKLFRVNLSGRDIYQQYLAAFEDGQDPTFRDPESSAHNCNTCNSFIRRYANVVAVGEDGSIMTLFDMDNVGEEYQSVCDTLSSLISGTKISGVFFETYNELNSLPYESCNKTQEVYRLGLNKNVKRYTKEEAEVYGVVKPNEIRTFHHMHLDLPKVFVDQSGKSIEQIEAFYRDKKQVFERCLEELTLDTLSLVKDLINQGSLLDGTAHLHAIEGVMELMKEADKAFDTNYNKDNWYWVNTYNLDERVAKFKNTLIGVFCTKLAEGEELNKACLFWNKEVDPVNYHKASAPITKRQIEEAQKFVQEQGLEDSFNRRIATIDDIKVSEILHSNVGSGEIQKASIFDGVKSTTTRHKRAEFDKLEEVSIDKFMKDILPTATSIEAFLDNKHEGNLVTMTTALGDASKPIFKWDNNYSWTFNGNLAGKSQIKEAVKTAGGKVDGILRFSIMWAGGNGDNSDLDAHCKEANGNLIYYGDKRSNTGGNLDIDITQPNRQMPKGAVENITYPSLAKMPDGKYTFIVNQYSARSSKGFKAEIEFNGELYSYEYNQPLSNKVTVAEVTLKNGQFSIEHKLPSSSSSKELWGLETKDFYKVNLVCLSPNHWGPKPVGNKHYMFMLDGCKVPHAVRGFHNENLTPELLKHRKVMEVLGNTNMIEPSDKQLAGLGFNSTVHDELVVKVKGSHQRMLKIKF